MGTMVKEPMLLDSTGKEIVRQIAAVAEKIGTGSNNSGTNGGNTGTASIEIGTVTSGDTAAAEIVGGKLNLVLPRGEKGATGATGAAGAKGDTGATGAKGDKGDKGDPGAAGAKGEAGAKGDKGDPGDGFTQEEKDLMLSLFEASAYANAEVLATYNALKEKWTGEVAKTYTITNNLSNVSTSNKTTSVLEGTSYSATLTASSGYTLKTVTVTMGGVNVTGVSYAGGSVNITKVTGNVVITATAEKNQEVEDDDTILYKLPAETVFKKDEQKFIDTGLKLFEKVTTERPSYTILLEVTAGSMENVGDSYCLLHCMEESTPYPGLSVSVWNSKNTNVPDYGFNLYGSAFSVAKTNGKRRIAIVINDGSFKLYRDGDSVVAAISNYTRNVDKTLILGAYQAADGSKGRYFDGTVHQFAVYQGVQLEKARTFMGVSEDGGVFDVTNNLTGVVTDNTSKLTFENDSYSATISVLAGYEIKTVTVTMGGVDITSTAYSDGTISIASVTGDIVITAVAETDEGANVLYRLPKETTFEHNNGSFVDTGLKLFGSITTQAPSYTILMEVTAGNLENVASTYCLLHCMEEASPWPGLVVAVWKSTSTDIPNYGMNLYDSKASLGGSNGKRRYAIVITSNNKYKVYANGNVTEDTIYNYTRNVDKTLILGAFQESDGTKGRFYDGTLHQFVVFDGVLSDEKINAFLAV